MHGFFSIVLFHQIFENNNKVLNAFFNPYTKVTITNVNKIKI